MQATSTTQQLGARYNGRRQPLFVRIRSWCGAHSAGAAKSVDLAKWGIFFNLAVLATSLASASSAEPIAETSSQNHDGKEMSQAATDGGGAMRRSQKEIEFVLSEVRKTLESNPYTEVVELLVDPDYRRAEGSYLVNVILDAHGRKILVGVMVTLHPVANTWETTMEFVD